VADNTKLIDSTLAAHNQSLAKVTQAVSPNPVTGAGGGGSLMSGCGCVTGGGAPAGAALTVVALAALVGWRSRRRR